MKFIVPAIALATLLTLPLASVANSGDCDKRKGPPPEAIEACVDLDADDACSVARDGEERAGVCMPGPTAELPLACRPERASGKRGGRRGPPPEAIDACEDLSSDDACSFEHHGNDVSGACQPGPSPDLPLACRPEGRQRR